MKKIYMIIVMALALSAAELNWTSDYQQALKDAKKQDKLVYILITSDSCKWCRKFEATTLQDKAIQKRLTKEFVKVHLSRDRHTIPKQFKTTPVPRHYFTDTKGNILYDSLGYRGVSCFDAFMDNAQDKLKVSQ